MSPVKCDVFYNYISPNEPLVVDACCGGSFVHVVAFGGRQSVLYEL